MTEKEEIFITADREKDLSLDFAWLRKRSIALIEQLSGDEWTDYNLHDPGVTILELLCYAITDLAYRTGFPVRDLLSTPQGEIRGEENLFIPKNEILTTNPVTLCDYRKAIMDEVPDLYNIWLEPLRSSYTDDHAKGLYRMVVQVKKEVAEKLVSGKIIEKRLKTQIIRTFTAKRNLCEDCIRDIQILKPVKIKVSAEIMVSAGADMEQVLEDVYRKLDASINTPVKYYTETEMAAMGYPVEDIYAGPLLRNGFIPDNALPSRKKEIDPDDIAQAIRDTEGVDFIKSLVLTAAGSTNSNLPYVLGDDSFPLLDDASEIKLFREKNAVHLGREVMNDIQLRMKGSSGRKFISSYQQSKQSYLKGTYRDLEAYHSIQHYLPLVYGLGEEGLPPWEPPARKAKAKQLKAYLMFFEQILANYLSQLAGFRHFFSASLSGKGAHTYYSQPLSAVPGGKDILKEETGNGYPEVLAGSIETTATYRERKNAVLDHLLARFNESLITYPATLFRSLYGDPYSDEKADMLLRWKADFLGHIQELSHDRTRAFDYLDSEPETGELTGYERRMAHLLCLENRKRRPLLNAFRGEKLILLPPAEAEARQPAGPAGKNSTEGGRDGGILWITDPEEIRQVLQSARKSEGRQENTAVFSNQTASLFKYGVDIRNYRILQDPGKNSSFLIIYRESSTDRWNMISRHTGRRSAVHSLKKLVARLRDINIASEGFHLVEHILLRPSLDEPVFGFRFYADPQQWMLEQAAWETFEERERTIAALLQTGEGTGSPEGGTEKIASYCRINPAAGASPGGWLSAIRSYNENTPRFYPRFEMQVQRPGGAVIRETFFNFRMTVVLPSWPARFQDKGFREFAEDLFRMNAPAHIRMRFLWKSIAEMKKFEDPYFEWLAQMKNQETTGRRQEIKDRLLDILSKENSERRSAYHP